MEPISSILKAVATRYRWQPAEALQQISIVWSDVVGEPLSQVTRPLSLYNGQLTVAVPSPVWTQELNYVESDLVTALNEALQNASVTRIRFVVRAFGSSGTNADGIGNAGWAHRLKALRAVLDAAEAAEADGPEDQSGDPPPG
ncbi:MAG: DUF721 domain-containing protein [Firmicutes bacterium]|jgi:predicted nucleic acid-binding Zn ribbon protein|nr:DUF721 domain-containing protein [Bacillota bacterium]